MRVEIYNSLVEIPQTLESIHRYTQNYKSSKLHYHSAQVYVTVFEALEAIMDEMLKNPASMEQPLPSQA